MQIQRSRIREIVNAYEGKPAKDLLTGLDYLQHETELETQNYARTIAGVMERARRDGAAASVVDECLVVQAFSGCSLGTAVFYAKFGAFGAVSGKMPDPNSCGEQELETVMGTHIVDLTSSNLLAMVQQSIFTFELSLEDMMDLLFRRVIVLHLNADRLIDLAAKKGMSLRKLSAKEEAQLSQRIGLTAIVPGIPGLHHKYRNYEQDIAGGSFALVLNELMRPVELLRSMQTTAEELESKMSRSK